MRRRGEQHRKTKSSAPHYTDRANTAQAQQQARPANADTLHMKHSKEGRANTAAVTEAQLAEAQARRTYSNADITQRFNKHTHRRDIQQTHQRRRKATASRGVDATNVDQTILNAPTRVQCNAEVRISTRHSACHAATRPQGNVGRTMEIRHGKLRRRHNGRIATQRSSQQNTTRKQGSQQHTAWTCRNARRRKSKHMTEQTVASGRTA